MWTIILLVRKIIFANNEIYHIFNLAIEKRPIFTGKREYGRALLALDYYRHKSILSLAQFLKLEDQKQELFFQLINKNKKLIEVLSFCLMPNHFHLLVRQLKNDGIKTYLSNFSNSYTRYFNTKHKRIGPIFQGTFKAVRIEDDDQLIHVCRYIHLNPVVSFVIKESDLEDYLYTSFPEFVGRKKGFCNKEVVLEYFSSIEKFKNFVHDQVDYGKKLEAVKHLTFDV